MTRLLLRFLRDLRLVPIVLVAIISLFALKTLGLLLDGGYLFDPAARVEAGKGDDRDITGAIGSPRSGATGSGSGAPTAAPARRQSWAQQMLNYPDPDYTGAVDTPPGPPKEGAEPAKTDGAAKKPVEPPASPGGTLVALDDHPLSPAERAILESLQKRRAELEARAHDLDMREDLMNAAEKRLEGRIAELKDLESRVDDAVQKKDDAEAARFKNVVTMYENMKAKDAAKIFDGLDMRVLLDVAKAINPRTMSEILAQMQPETAQRLTGELAARSTDKERAQAANLPKIVGKPTPN